MRQKFTFIYSWILLIVLSVSVDNFALSAPQEKQDTTSYFFSPKKTKKKNPLSLSMPPIKAGVVSTQKANVVANSDKILSSVEVSNPITDQINIKYIVSRNTNVSIKIMDVLGNNIVTLFSQRVEPGEQTFSYALNNKLTRGFYFVRVVAGTEFVIRRISVL